MEHHKLDNNNNYCVFYTICTLYNGVHIVRITITGIGIITYNVNVLQ